MHDLKTSLYVCKKLFECFPQSALAGLVFGGYGKKGLRIITNQECDYISLFIHI